MSIVPVDVDRTELRVWVVGVPGEPAGTEAARRFDARMDAGFVHFCAIAAEDVAVLEEVGATRRSIAHRRNVLGRAEQRVALFHHVVDELLRRRVTRVRVDATLDAGDRPAAAVAAAVAAQEVDGFDATWAAEAAHDPFLPLAIGAAASERIRLGTGIAVALSRSPMHLAYLGHDLQVLSKGRFLLGLGSQVKAHVERRFSTPFDRPAARMRELVAALVRQGRWEALAAVIDEEMLDTFALVAEPADVLARVDERYAGLVDRVSFSTPYDLTPAVAVGVDTERRRLWLLTPSRWCGTDRAPPSG